MRILVADDEQASAHALKELLEVIGHQVVGPAADGDEAVRLASEQRPDLGIFDLDMPRLSGLDAIDRITRSRPIPVIVLTGHSEPEYVDRAAALPVFHYLSKPAGAAALIPAIRLDTDLYLAAGSFAAAAPAYSVAVGRLRPGKLVHDHSDCVDIPSRGSGAAHARGARGVPPAPLISLRSSAIAMRSTSRDAIWLIAGSKARFTTGVTSFHATNRSERQVQ